MSSKTPGRPRKVDLEKAFEMYYNEVGVRGNWRDIAREFGVAESTIRNIASEKGWRRRAIERDQGVREQVDKKMVKTHAQRVYDNLKVIDALKAIFARQLMPGLDGRENPNQLREVSVREYLEIVKIEALLTGNPTNIPGETAAARTLAEIEAELAELPEEEAIRELEMMAESRGDSDPHPAP